MVDSELESLFPNLATCKWEITSPTTDTYNCIAWAAGATDQWWWPDPLGEEYWPLDAPRSASVSAFVLVYQTLGYLPCESSEWEERIEKIAIFAQADGNPTHAARQLPSGQWTSKLGSMEDVTHDTLDSISGEIYGPVVQILQRPLRSE